MDAELAGAFRRFARFECHGSSPLYEWLSRAIAADRDLLALMAEAPIRQRRPNLLFAAVHYLLLSGEGDALARFYPSLCDATTPPPETDPWPAFRRFCTLHREQLAGLLGTRRTQTNEVRRSALLLPAFARASRLFDQQPMALVDTGASAGLNLLFDAFGYNYGQGRTSGSPASPVQIVCELRGTDELPIPAEMPEIATRVGIDVHPLNVFDNDDALWLRACVWPEHVLRMRLLQAAIEVARRAPPRLLRGDLLDVLPTVAAELPPSTPICLFHTATLTYLSADAQTAFARTVERLANTRPIAWIALEGHGISPASDLAQPDEAERRRAGLLSLTHFRDGRRRDQLLGFADLHGAWLEWVACC